MFEKDTSAPASMFAGVNASIVAMTVVIVIAAYWISCSKTSKVKSSIDNEYYNVLEEYHDANDAAELLSRLNMRMFRFLAYLKDKYDINSYNDGTSNGTRDFNDSLNHMPWDANSLPVGALSGSAADNERLRAIARRALERYNPEVIYENHPTRGDGTAYTLNKGARLMLCLRDKKQHKLVDDDVLLFVTLHELAHMGNDEWGHEPVFWEVFKYILVEAKAAGVYEPINFEKYPVDYCGLHINYNPYFDNGVKNI